MSASVFSEGDYEKNFPSWYGEKKSKNSHDLDPCLSGKLYKQVSSYF